jgi:hypothetical protein
MDGMDVDEDLATRSARVACKQLLQRFYASVDAGKATRGIEVFAPGALIDMPTTIAHGADQIARVLSGREAATTRVTVHAIANFDFTLKSSREAAARGALVVYAGAPGDVDDIPEVSRYAADFRRRDDGWKIARLRVQVIGHEKEVSG